MKNFAVTTVKNNAEKFTAQARAWSEELGVLFLPRKGGTLDDFLRVHSLDGLIIASVKGAEFYSSGGRLFFHPGMSILRIENILSGSGDRLISAMQLKAGMSVLDCTLGMAADACTASFVAGQAGKVTALEASLPTWFVVSEGLRRYQAQRSDITDAMRRIETMNVDYAAYLKNAPDNSFDIIYFDPMFEYTVKGSCSIDPLKAVARHDALDISILGDAKRVARERVVIKLGSYSKLSLGSDAKYTSDGKYSNVKYAVIEAQK